MVTMKPKVLLLLVPLIASAMVACNDDDETSGPPASLRGETVRSRLSTDGTTTGCSTGSDGTFTFDLSGDAEGPYAGTFTAHGEVTLTNGAITTLNGNFEIISGPVTVSGRLISVTGTSTGFCVPDYGLASAEYRYRAVASSGGRSSDSLDGSGFLTVSGGSIDASQLFADFG
jgi:hypothetical protein